MLNEDQKKMLKYEERIYRESLAKKKKLVFQKTLLEDDIKELESKLIQTNERIEWYKSKAKFEFLHL